MSQQSSQAPEQGAARGNRAALVAIILALLVAALALALWFDLRQMRAQALSLEAQLKGNVAALEQNAAELRSALLAAEARERDQRLVARQEALEQGMQALRDQLGREHAEWVVAESDYLLRYASRRLLLERDVRGALIALRSADALLADGANPLYLPVREKLRAEIQSLEHLPQLDVDGMALELGGLSRQLASLPLATARRAISGYQAETAQAAEEGSWAGRLLSSMWHEVKSLVSVRRLDQKIQPLLPPEQRYFLEQNLRLRLELARLALLRGEVANYQENLATAAAWLDDYYDSEDAAVRNSRAAIAALAQINIAPALPEIGEALRALERIHEKQTGRKPAAALRGSQP